MPLSFKPGRRHCLLSKEARAALGVGPKIMAQLEQAGLIRRLQPDELVLEIKPIRDRRVRRGTPC